MEKYVNKLRERPKEVRAQMAFVGAVVVAVLFFLVWTLSLGSRLQIEPVDPTIAEHQRKMAEMDAEQTDVRTGVGDMFGELRAGATALLFGATQSDDVEMVEDNNTLDFDTLLRERAESGSAIEHESAASAQEAVILIGTSSVSTAEEVE